MEFSRLARGLRGDPSARAMIWRSEWLRHFPGTDYRPTMNLRAIDGRGFFQNQDDAALAQKRELLITAPEFYRCESNADADFADFLGIEKVRLAESVEPDWVVLENGKVAGGCVCFPTMWSLPEKIGQSLAAVHGRVPGLNDALGAKIDQFLGRLAIGIGYGRENWGLSGSALLDQHPRHGLEAISADAPLSEIWLRMEEQALIRLSEHRIVFGIRIKNVRLDTLPDGQVCQRLAHALRTMPEEMAAYKRLTACRENVASALETVSA